MQHRLLNINKADVLLMGFWLHILSAFGLVRITAVIKMLGELGESTCAWKICRVSECLPEGR